MNSPWGKVQSNMEIKAGINFVTTAGHGGFILSPRRINEMPSYFRNGYFYETDVDYCLVILSFPQFFTGKEVKQAKDSLRNWYPNLYEKHFETVLQEGQSYKKDQRIFRAKYSHKYASVSAWGDWHGEVPKGMVGVFAVRGGRNEDGMYASDDRRYFLVPKEEYDKRSENGFIIDEEKHKEWETGMAQRKAERGTA